VLSFRLLQYLQILLGFYTWTLLGQGLLFLFVGAQGERNFVFRLFRQINFPVRWVARHVTPRFIVDQHISWVAFALVILLRVAVYIAFFRAGAIPPITPVGN
jgi:hypothetical protein